MGGFNAATSASPRSLRFAPSPGPSKAHELRAPWMTKMANVPQLLVNLKGECVYASSALAQLLQCGLSELYGHGWRSRLSPYADRPWDVERVIAACRAHKPLRLPRPDGLSEYVSRVRTVTDPEDPEKVTGFYGRVQLVRVHRRMAVVVATTLPLLSA